ncbi:MAG: hypothetical protein NTV49_07525, partial [Kiritimatiellaeota bacterium]|nr:hypothetical protein [Kiritimatiellota bacterium]
MPTTPQPMTREDEAREEMRRTQVSRVLAGVMLGLFLAIVTAVPVLQIADEEHQASLGLRATRLPTCCDLAPLLAQPAQAWASSAGSLPHRVLTANRALIAAMTRYEKALEDASWLTRLWLPPAQQVMTRWFGVGNEKVVRGQRDWLFYRPDVEYVTGKGFLDPHQQKGRIKAQAAKDGPLQPDPVAAIVDFNRQLKAMGIRLIVMPVPVKPSVQSAELTGGSSTRDTAVQNPSLRAFVEQLSRQDILVFDCGDLLVRTQRKTKLPAYLARDTHWRPETAALVAEQLAAWMRRARLLPDQAPVKYRRAAVALAGRGDLVALLKLPETQTLYPLEPVTLQPVLALDGSLWTRSATADVIVLGDSFANIFSLPSLGWGSSAGFVEQLSYALQRPV